MHVPVVIDERNDLAVLCKDFLDLPRRAERSTELKRLSCIEELDGEYALCILDNAYELCSSVCTHADMILLTL